MRSAAIVTTGAGAMLAAVVLGCGSDDGAATSSAAAGTGKQVRIYSSQPLQGATRGQAQSVINGEKLALSDAGGKGGKCPVDYVPLDDSTAAAAQWDPGAVSANARKALGDKATIAYLGEFNSGASAVSLPILNEAPILQVSPSNTYVGLTKAEGAEPGEPDKYYPNGVRTYGRVVPADHIQAAAVVRYMQEEEVTKLFILNDKEVYGSGIARAVESGAKAAGIDVIANDGIDTKAANQRGLAAKIARSGADGFFFGGNTYGGAIQLWKDLYAANPAIKLFGPDGVAEESFYGEVGEPGRSTFITVSTLPPKYYPASAQTFFKAYETAYGKPPETYGIYGYEAMSVVLDAMARATDCGDRKQVLDAFFATKDRDSVLGKYSIDPDGDTTLTQYGGYRVQGKKLVFDRVINAAGS
jgi:branched-chain amino acid transport system substrate-binding protein